VIDAGHLAGVDEQGIGAVASNRPETLVARDRGEVGSQPPRVEPGRLLEADDEGVELRSVGGTPGAAQSEDVAAEELVAQ